MTNSVQTTGSDAVSLQRRLGVIFELIRVEAWISKLPAFGFVLLCLQEPFVYSPPSAMAITLVLAALHLSAGYAMNDLADWDHDIDASDERAAHAYGRRVLTQVVLGVLALTLGALALFWSFGFPLNSILIAVFVMASGVIYSFGPRLKDRASIGVVFSALTQWVFPFLVVVPCLQNRGGAGAIVLAVELVAWLFILGVHGALRHQLRDYHRDLGRRTTFAVVHGPAKTLACLKLCRAALVIICIAPVVTLGGSALGVRTSLIIGAFAFYHAIYHKRLPDTFEVKGR